MFSRLVALVVFVPLGLVLIVLAVANRQDVTLALNPFNPADQMLSVSAPLFVMLILSVILGLLLGFVIAWISQSKHRKRARREAKAAQHWQTEADRHKTRAEEIAGQGLPQIAMK
ncbi:DUF1049 domain-containing protein [Peteryoungia desertarenae]|uniref:DUF1049 domain-containing protein n=1 Tax=Peteryoungia desertarenae TaxID=1813451 RepID=A0ABX6QM79_9HYPH|nr:LapA family protein [Peteryoungia desertarenae]QLF69190.1 DUF1049 domain-containing protein [Peteryoungia desertarenae]